MKTTSEETQLLNVIPFKPERPLTAGFSVLSKLQIGLLTPEHNDPESQPCVVTCLCWEEAVALDQLLQWSVTQVNTFKVQLQPGLWTTTDHAFTKQFTTLQLKLWRLALKKGLMFKVGLVNLSFILHTSTKVLKSWSFQIKRNVYRRKFYLKIRIHVVLQRLSNNCVLKHRTVVKHSFRLI